MFIDVQYPFYFMWLLLKPTMVKSFIARGWELALNWNDQIGQVKL